MFSIEQAKDLSFSVFFSALSLIRDAAEQVVGVQDPVATILKDRECNVEDCLSRPRFQRLGVRPYALAFTPSIKESVSVFVSNSTDGWFTMVNRIQKITKERTVYVSTSTDCVAYPRNSIIVFGEGKEVRVIRSMKDPKWDFFEKGMIQGFEDPELYQSRRIRDRMNRSVVIDYCKRMGLEIENPSFWNSNGNCLIFDPVFPKEAIVQEH